MSFTLQIALKYCGIKALKGEYRLPYQIEGFLLPFSTSLSTKHLCKRINIDFISFYKTQEPCMLLNGTKTIGRKHCCKADNKTFMDG